MAREQDDMMAVLETNTVLETMAKFDEMKEVRSPLFKLCGAT